MMKHTFTLLALMATICAAFTACNEKIEQKPKQKIQEQSGWKWKLPEGYAVEIENGFEYYTKDSILVGTYFYHDAKQKSLKRGFRINDSGTVTPNSTGKLKR